MTPLAVIIPDAMKPAAGHYDERGLAVLILMIASTNAGDRLDVTARRVAGAWG